MELAQRLSRIAESQTIQMAKLSRELRAQGQDIIDLSIGEPDFDTPQHIKDAAKKAIDEGYTHYTPVPGYPELRKAICEKLKRDNGVEYTPDRIVVSTGAKQSIANVVLSLVDPGDEVIIPTPYWVSYSEIVRLEKGEVVFVKGTFENEYKITPEQLEAAITPKSKLFIYSSPCNPTGSVYTQEELDGLAEVFKKHPQVFIISDEIYEYINYQGAHASLAKYDFLKDRLIIVNGLSKGYAMTGWRLGYIAAPVPIAKACDKIQGQITSGTCSITQRAGITALTSDMKPTHDMVAEFRRRRDYMVRTLRTIPGLKVTEPQGAFYVFPDVSAYYGKKAGDTVITNADALCMYLIREAHISTVTGEAFGEPDCIRLSYAASMDKLEEALRRLKDALAKLGD
ncbi:pyridoxal phosphate-dependent aminotransferase [Compostibacter hankyongensis]|uniref:Aminotransferase n=1 Tax=Compostibacter hankyongensis TaxID=1007089 RepID=A0ABP8FQ57_9BACT